MEQHVAPAFKKERLDSVRGHRLGDEKDQSWSVGSEMVTAVQAAGERVRGDHWTPEESLKSRYRQTNKQGQSNFEKTEYGRKIEHL